MASSCNKSFSGDYMLLNSNEASFLDLCTILFSSDIGKRKFVDCPEGVRPEPFGRRWIIFVSVLAQKMLQAVSKPLAGFGSGVEYWLNLLSSNQGFFRLIMNSIKGNVIYPEKTSASFVSFIGHIDSRLHLDSKISDGDKRYHALLSIMAAKASYENKNFIDLIVKDYWKMDILVSLYDFWNDYQEKATTQAFILEDKKDLIIVAFRGTETFDAEAWSTDADISWYELPQIGKVHGGFLKALGLQTSQGFPKEQDENKPQVAYYAIRKLLKEKLQSNDKAKFIVTGHSLGGALAALFPAILAMHEEKLLLERMEGVYTFGQPRVGDEKFGEFMKGVIKEYDVKYCRCVYGYDLVPRLPYDDATLMFKHFGSCIYFDSNYQGKVLEEEPDKNYFSLMSLIPKTVNACWELIRSFTISYTKGPDYKEGGLLRLLRVIGFLLVAGVPAHCPQDYVNSIRLGPPQVFLSILNANDKKLFKIQ
ncbi:hypothetical protein ACJIZ3_008072 [Penstemon smallii]|uniref:Fungal lipase-type domain-containing protein n=1 Tax=Penstemon smallii TaxID=265156 RepID=A0ABD3T9M7_9LAMI